MLRGTTAAKPLSRRRLAAMNSPTRKWRNWQTRRIQDATSCPTVAATPASSFDLRSAATGPGRSRGYVQGTTGHDAESEERDSSLGVGLGLVLIARQPPDVEQTRATAPGAPGRIQLARRRFGAGGQPRAARALLPLPAPLTDCAGAARAHTRRPRPRHVEGRVTRRHDPLPLRAARVPRDHGRARTPRAQLMQGRSAEAGRAAVPLDDRGGGVASR